MENWQVFGREVRKVWVPSDQESGRVVGREGTSPRTCGGSNCPCGGGRGCPTLGRVGKELVFLLRQL